MNQRLSTVDAHVRSFRTFRPFQSTHLDCGHVKIELVPLTGVSHNQFLVYPPTTAYHARNKVNAYLSGERERFRRQKTTHH